MNAPSPIDTPPATPQPSTSGSSTSPKATRKPAALSRWAIPPLVLYALVQVFVGWPLAQLKSPGSFAVSIFAGYVIGSLMMMVVPSLIVHRLSRGSQLAATFTFGVMAILASLAEIGAWARHQQLSPAQATQAVQVVAAEGRFTLPPRWRAVSPEELAAHARPKTKAQLGLLDESGTWIGMAMIDVGKPALPTALATAQTFAAPAAGSCPTRSSSMAFKACV